MSNDNFREREELLWLVPLPPPFAGPEIVSKMLFDTYSKTNNNVTCLNATVRAQNKNKGKLDMEGLLATFLLYRRLLAVLVSKKPGLVYLLIASNKIAFIRDAMNIMTARMFGCKIVAHYHGAHFLNFYRGQSKSCQWFIRTVLNKINSVIVLGNSLKSMFEQISPQLNIEVLYNGLSAEKHKRVEITRKSNDINLFFLGHISYAKGFYDLIVAYKRLLNKFENIHLDYAGTMFSRDTAIQVCGFLAGESRKIYLENADRIHAEIEEFCSSASKYNATYHGVVDHSRKLKIFSQADIFVQPSYSEGFPMSVLEAMFMGLPVVVTAVGALPEVVKDGENGFVTEAGDVDALEKRLETLIKAADLRQRMGKINAEYARNKFSIEKMADNLGHIFKRITTNEES